MFDDAFDLLKRTGRPGAAAPFKTGAELVSSGCLPYREPEGADDQDVCSLASPACSQKPALQGEFAPTDAAARCPLPAARCPLPAARCPLPAARCPLPAARCPLPAARCPLAHPGPMRLHAGNWDVLPLDTHSEAKDKIMQNVRSNTGATFWTANASRTHPHATRLERRVLW